MDVIKPPALKQGQTIGVMAPSGPIYAPNLNRAIALLERLGYDIVIHPQTYEVKDHSAGTPRQKTTALHDLFRDKSINAIFCADGGDDAGRILPLLDFNLVAHNPKIIMGYSDPTMLLHGITKRTGLVTFHGPTMNRLGREDPLPAAQLTHCFNILSGKPAQLDLSGSQIIQNGTAYGQLVGGNLSMIRTMMGTPAQPDFTGKILFLEDLNTDIDDLNRVLIQLMLAGAFDKISGLIVGNFQDITDKGYNKFRKTFEELVVKEVEHRKIPVILNAPLGHGADLYTLPIGMPARLDATNAVLEFAAPTTGRAPAHITKTRPRQAYINHHPSGTVPYTARL